MVATEEPILSRIDRLDNMLKKLEEIRGCNLSPKSSCSTPTISGSDGRFSSVDLSPKSLEKHCRPIENVISETEIKGTLIDRLNQVEDRMLKLCMQLEEVWEGDRKREERKDNSPKKKGLKQLVKQCVKARSRKHEK
ncbi:hypothetical protein Lalb_Chr01g0008051 [Lupinus albus]|uniref:Uncharacterized protein n=1 Tax=Lupinus albus TaxID=3870 RepID=A0A6A4R667_LUPAL|nr:hypothetical protein Lalb_Chr01g0008051 [Lupinus albus]